MHPEALEAPETDTVNKMPDIEYISSTEPELHTSVSNLITTPASSGTAVPRAAAGGFWGFPVTVSPMSAGLTSLYAPSLGPWFQAILINYGLL